MFNTYFWIAFVYFIAYVYSIEIAPRLVGKTGLAGKMNNIHETCVMGCKANLCEYSWKGNSYYIGSDDASSSPCLVTFWSVSHFMLYSVLGYLFPDYFWQTFAAGVCFELYEWVKYDCQDSYDILFNSSGFLVGKYLIPKIVPRPNFDI